MPKATPTELLILVAIFVFGIAASTLLAAFYPDSNSYLYVSAFMVVFLLVAAFVMARKKAT